MPTLTPSTTLPFGTLDLRALQLGSPFLHGQLRHIHTMGPYAVVSYHPLRPDRTPDTGQLLHYGYVNGQPGGRAATHIDAAIAMCIALRAQGPDHYADTIFMSLLRQDAA